MPGAAQQIDSVEYEETIIEGSVPGLCKSALPADVSDGWVLDKCEHGRLDNTQQETKTTRNFTHFGSSRTNAAAAVSATELADAGAEAAACVGAGAGADEGETV